VEDGEVDAHLGARGREHLDLSGAEKGRRIGLRAFLEHSQHDLSPGGFGEPGELVHRSLGAMPPDRARYQADERRALAPRYSARTHRSTSSQAIAPGRISRTSSSTAWTTVDGGPPLVLPRSSNSSTSRCSNTRAT